MFYLFHIEKIDHGTDEEIAQIFFLRTRKNNQCFRIELLRGQHGSYGIEVCIHVGGDDGQIVFRG